MNRFVATLLVIALALASGSAIRADTPATRTILLFVVKPQTDDAQKGIASWIQVFQNNLRFLLSDFSAGNSASPAIKVVFTSQNIDAVNTDALAASFENQPSLQVLDAVALGSAEVTRIDNDIYLGDLKGSLNDPYVHISREIQPAQYSITREALAAVTLYAYAMALAQTLPESNGRYVVCRVLDRANMYKDRDLGMDNKVYLDDLFRAISTELESRTCGGKQ